MERIPKLLLFIFKQDVTFFFVWQDALPYEYSQKEIKVDTDGAVCLQINGKIITGSEDCLFLSVHTPNVRNSTGL